MDRTRDLVIRGKEFEWWVSPHLEGNLLFVKNQGGKVQKIFVREQSIPPKLAKKLIIKYVLGDIYGYQKRRQKILERTNR